ncbi:rhodanese-like domain-containing protein [Vacuolonema iberomarrocanum]|uniref:rhodanese-like domain-containing protein n=1 Tax=Vacuolonema iberomarrocanum TaxID=3454632 RepID=UPI0019F5AC6E|nr:rhodanese-like domain-containing protein [filamentous cyanobacterium LEGE 07170]
MARSLAWKIIRRLVRWRFLGIRFISTEALATWLTQPNPPVLLDVRDAEEFAVSHLPNAHHAPTLDAVRHLPIETNTPIVAYCSVGYRSAQFVQQLQDAGFSQAMNLEGSIFQWANEGRSLVRDRQPVQAVHPYAAVWKVLLHPSVQQEMGDRSRKL